MLQAPQEQASSHDQDDRLAPGGAVDACAKAHARADPLAQHRRHALRRRARRQPPRLRDLASCPTLVNRYVSFQRSLYIYMDLHGTSQHNTVVFFLLKSVSKIWQKHHALRRRKAFEVPIPHA